MDLGLKDGVVIVQGDLSDMGPVFAFLGIRVNSYMTGAFVSVDGGSDNS